jgi:hypothetical protein
MLTLCAMVILSPISANIWSHHQRSNAARHIQSWARYMLARIHVDTRRSNAATYIQSHARHLAARHLATRHRAANCIRWWAIWGNVRCRWHVYLTHARIEYAQIEYSVRFDFVQVRFCFTPFQRCDLVYTVCVGALPKKISNYMHIVCKLFWGSR